MSYLYKENVDNMKKILCVKSDDNEKIYNTLKKYMYETDKKVKDIFNVDSYELKDILKSNDIYFREEVYYEKAMNINAKEFLKLIINRGYFGEFGFNKIYKDPDEFDEDLYRLFESKYKDLGIEYKVISSSNRLVKDNIYFSLDGVIGWKALIDLYCSEKKFVDNEEDFIKIHETIRNPKNAGNFMWPVHLVPTINTERYRKFNDRIDYTLFDIKNFFDEKFDNNNLKLKNAYFNQRSGATTLEWLNTFKDKGFDYFVEVMQLERFCRKVNDHYEVIDIASKNMEDKITKYLCDEDEYDARDKYPITDVYVENLIKLIKE